MIYYVGAWIALIVFVIIWYLIRRKRINEAIKRIDELNAEVEKRRNEIEIAQKAFDELSKKITVSTMKLVQLDNERVTAIQRGQEARDATDRLLKAEHERAAAELSRVKEVEEEKLKHEFELKRINLEKQFAEYKTELENNYNGLSKHYMTELTNITLELEEYQAKRAAINEQLRREEELANEQDFHRIVLSTNDKEDIHFLLSIEDNIHNKELLHKLIWTEYIQRPFNSTLKNILGNRNPKNVIYCIENINNHKKYIGKTRGEYKDRQINHLKASLGIGTISHQYIHDA